NSPEPAQDGKTDPDPGVKRHQHPPYRARTPLKIYDFFNEIGPMRAFAGNHILQGSFRIPVVRTSCSILCYQTTGERTKPQFAASQ
ncbi:hypothetical protein, partial [Cohaesibacter intestini]|uniref:hypothetical protein n=1 Tax=Cohaesibacter intestini TaxID=2211145 RepID=UPI001AECA9FA